VTGMGWLFNFVLACDDVIRLSVNLNIYFKLWGTAKILKCYSKEYMEFAILNADSFYLIKPPMHSFNKGPFNHVT
jgi:hypothetical protein